VALLGVAFDASRAAAQAAKKEQAEITGRSLADAWNRKDLDAVMALFAGDAVVQGGQSCCAGKGADQIQPFIAARFAEDYQVELGTAETKNNTASFLSQVFAKDGDHLPPEQAKKDPNGPSATDPETARIDVTVDSSGRITRLVLGLSPAAIERANNAKNNKKG
jgi:hypothetical protein